MAAAILNPPEQRLILQGISWETYGALLADLKSSSAPRLTYDRGRLEIMTPSPEHERYNRTIEQIVEILSEEANVDIDSLGSTTFKRQDAERGFEPDSCFYVRNASRIRGKKRIDLTLDPPPDLVIEIDITSPSMDKFPIFAELGVPEIWRYDGKAAQIFELVDGEYRESESSRAFPVATAAMISSLVKESELMSRPDWKRRVRELISRY